MEVVLQTKGLLSLPVNPRMRVSNLPQGLRHRLNTRTNRDFGGFSLTVDGFQRYIGSVSKNHVFGKNSRNFHIYTKDVLVVTAKGSTANGCVAFGDDTDILKGVCGESFASFPQVKPLSIWKVKTFFFTIKLFDRVIHNHHLLRNSKNSTKQPSSSKSPTRKKSNLESLHSSYIHLANGTHISRLKPSYVIIMCLRNI
ncbi:hypothetical protein NE237_004986 [Protea cynaroides]|uniref:Uncharacterized protein n=1 Tax=Protea cynaroides TaxID=273540 RepID=A0A9Q0KJS4_9MAGN|nr:hypothetical protein NE237_004986 [Protea cynaroides]